MAGLPAAASGNVELVAGYVPPLKAIEAAAGCRAIVTMRLHPALFAAASGTPFGLVLDGQRTEVLADTPLAGRVASPHDRAAIAAVIGRAVGGQDDEDFWESLGPLRARLADVGRRLGVWLAAVTPGGGG